MNIAVLAAGVTAAAAMVALAPAPGTAPAAAVVERSLLDAFPAGAAFVLTVDLGRIRRTSLGAALAGSGRDIPGLGPLDELCGYDPTSSARQLAFAVPSAPAASSELGVAAAGDFNGDRLVHCVETVVRARGGEPVALEIGDFVAVKDGSGRAEGLVAVRDHGPVLLGPERYLRQMIATYEGSGRSLRDDAAHVAMRRDVGPDAAAAASWAMAPNWLTDVTGSKMAALSPLASVRTLVVSANFEHGLELTASLGCPDPETCEGVKDQLTNLHRELGPDAASVFGLDVLGRIRMSAAERSVRLELQLDEAQASDALEHALLRLKTFKPPPTGGAEPSNPGADAPPVPDERVVAPR